MLMQSWEQRCWEIEMLNRFQDPNGSIRQLKAHTAFSVVEVCLFPLTQFHSSIEKNSTLTQIHTEKQRREQKVKKKERKEKVFIQSDFTIFYAYSGQSDIF